MISTYIDSCQAVSIEKGYSITNLCRIWPHPTMECIISVLPPSKYSPVQVVLVARLHNNDATIYGMTLLTLRFIKQIRLVEDRDNGIECHRF